MNDSAKQSSTSACRIGTACVELGDLASVEHKETFASRPTTDSLQCRILLARQGDGGVCIVSLDLTEIPHGGTYTLRNAVAGIVGLPVDCVLVCYTHTHSAFMPHQLDLAILENVVVSAAKLAITEAENADQVGLGWVETGTKYAVNRRVDGPRDMGRFSAFQNVNCDDDGERINAIGWIKNKLKEYGAAEDELAELTDGAYLDGPNDGRLQLLLFADGDRPVAGIVRFNAHPVILSSGFYKPHLSRDYCGVLVDRLEALWGCPMLFLQGPCGDQRTRHIENTPAECERIGGELAGLLGPGMVDVQWAELDQIEVEHSFVSSPLADDIAESLSNLEAKRQKAKASLDELGHGVEHLSQRKAKGEQVSRLNILRHLIGDLDYLTEEEIFHGELTQEVSLVLLGPWLLVGLPSEVGSVASRWLQPMLSDRAVICGYVNGVQGYILEGEDLARGGYEALSCMVGPECMEQLVAATLELFAEAMRPPEKRE